MLANSQIECRDTEHGCGCIVVSIDSSMYCKVSALRWTLFDFRRDSMSSIVVFLSFIFLSRSRLMCNVFSFRIPQKMWNISTFVRWSKTMNSTDLILTLSWIDFSKGRTCSSVRLTSLHHHFSEPNHFWVPHSWLNQNSGPLCALFCCNDKLTFLLKVLS